MQVFAGRDAETLYDDFAIVHADQPSLLLPASMDLWNLPAMSDPGTARGFLSTYGITPELIRDSVVDFQFNDSGFHGRAGLAFREALRTAYGVEDDRTTINLVAANPDAIGKAIVEHYEAYDPIQFSRTLRLCGDKRVRSLGDKTVIATALQLQPRYTGPYDILQQEADGAVRAQSSRNTWADTCTDRPKRVAFKIGKMVFERPNSGTNLSIVHALVAARAQYRTVSTALQHINSR